MTLLLMLVALVLGSVPAAAQLDARVLETKLVERYCAGMKLQQYVLPDGTEIDCVSDTHAIEVEKSDSGWYTASLRRFTTGSWTRDISEHPDDFGRWSRDIDGPRYPGIILVCLREREPENPDDFCTEHTAHLYRIVEEYRLPVTIWDCNYPADLTLDDCQEIKGP